MPRPDPKTIIREATRLKDERYKSRDADLEAREQLRFRKKVPVVPVNYQNSATIYMTPLMQEEGRQLAATIAAFPQIHMPPPSPELQPQTTLCEQWVAAAHQELESHYGHVWDKVRQSQIHAKIGWIYCGAKRKPYDGEPTPPKEDDYAATLMFAGKQDAFKREAGIAAFFDYRHVPTNTLYCRGDVSNPLAIYEIKDIDEDELVLMYGLAKDADGTYSKPAKGEITTMPSGEAEGRNNQARKMRVVEYWDRQWCMIVLQNTNFRWRGSQASADGLVLEEWEHKWGRVPYFAAPAFETDVLAEEYKFESPLDGIYTEAEMHNMLRTMMSNVAYLTGFPSWQINTQKDGEQILDDAGQPKTMMAFEPGTMFQAAPGQTVNVLPMQAGSELQNEVLASEARMRQYSIADIAKGIAPGADTANSAITQLKRLQRSSLEPMAENSARQARQMYQAMFQHVKDIREPIPVYDRASGEMLELRGAEIPTLNIQVKVSPDTGQDNLLEEKQAAEMKQMGLIAEVEFHERRGKENPEEYVRANVLERAWMMQEPQLQTQVMAALGSVDAIAQLVAASEEGGDATAAVPNIMQQIRDSQDGGNGLGMGSPDMPRGGPVRTPVIAADTQPEMGM